jgi:sugar phosphate permease
MRLEVLIFHQNGRLSRAAILVPIVAMALVIGLAYAIYGLTAALFAGIGDASFHAIPMMIGLSLSAVTNFTFVQVRQLNPLLAMRVWQGLALAALQQFGPLKSALARHLMYGRR